jgi:MFS family permease
VYKIFGNTIQILNSIKERGKRMALTNLAVFGGAFFTPILVGKITHTIGWPWTFYFVAIFTGACLPLIVFFVPETAFRRDAHLSTDMASSDDLNIYQKSGENGHELQSTRPETAQEKNGTESGSQRGLTENAESQTPNPIPKASYSQMLLPFNGRKSDENYLRLLLRPFPLFAHPAILWACLIQGCMIGWTVFIGIILAAIFLGPPLFWTEVKTGYSYAGAFIGAIAGFLVAGGLADWSAKLMTRRNGGIYEPEFRIILVIPMCIFGCLGLYGFGITADRPIDFPHITPIIFFGFEVMGMVIGAVAASLYIVDAHREFPRHFDISTYLHCLGDIAIEAFTCLIIFKVSTPPTFP